MLNYRSTDKSSLSSLRARSYDLLKTNYLSTKSRLQTILDKQKYVKFWMSINLLRLWNLYRIFDKSAVFFSEMNFWFCDFKLSKKKNKIFFFVIVAKPLKVAQHHRKFIRHLFPVNRNPIHWHRYPHQPYHLAKYSHKLLLRHTIHFSRRSHHFYINLNNLQIIKACVLNTKNNEKKKVVTQHNKFCIFWRMP